MIGRLIVFLSCSITSRTRVARVKASSSPTSPCRAQGKRPCGSGTTQRNLACSLPSGASAVSTDLGSPCIGDDCPVNAWNHTVPRTPVYSLIGFPRQIHSLSRVRGTLWDPTVATYRASQFGCDRVLPANSDAPVERLSRPMSDGVRNLGRIVADQRIGQARRVSLLPAMNCPDECAIARVEFFDAVLLLDHLRTVHS